MIGGNLSWMHAAGDGEHLYVTLARGYKGGGFNIGSGILSEQRRIRSGIALECRDRPEVCSAPRALCSCRSDVFYMRRQHMQVYLSEQLQQNNPLEYVFFTQNAADGENYGLEAQGSYRLTAAGSSQAARHCCIPAISGVGGAFAEPRHRRARAAVRARLRSLRGDRISPCPAVGSCGSIRMRIDSFYYYTSDAQTSQRLSSGEPADRLSPRRLDRQRVGRNLFDVRYAQQGFYFGLIPPNYPNQSFLQLGDPRQVGVTIRYDLGP